MLKLVSSLLMVAAALGIARADKVKSPQDARAVRVVRAAIRAAGGLKALRRVYARFTAYTSTDSKKDGKTKVVSHWVAPDKWVLKDRRGPMEFRVIGKRCVAMINGRAVPCSFSKEKVQGDLFFMHASHLYPLVQEGVVLRHLGTRRAGGRRVALVEVKDARGPSKVILGFDTITKLIYTAQQEEVVGGVKRLMETRTLSHTEVKGVKVPRKVEEYANGQHQGTTTLEKLIPGKVDRRLFNIPE